MVCTLDGRTVNERTAAGLGTRADRKLMAKIRPQVDAVLVGANTLRTNEKLGYPKGLTRCVITRSGNVPVRSSFFTHVPERTVLFLAGEAEPAGLPAGVTCVRIRDVGEALRWLAEERGIRVLLVEGGSVLNGHLFALGLVDELFLTLAPKLKAGEGPTILTGPAFPPEHLPRLDLISVWEEEGELFLRYLCRHGA
jgi:2,5-diamino-6-(ribosylamino)-4(3H)-pyrimidinone 5'-phosphate reductase